MRQQEKIYLRYLLGISLGLVILGLCNVIYGEFKSQQYLDVLTVSSDTLPLTENNGNLPEMSQFISKESLEDQQTRVRHRLDFYRVIIVGGQYLSATGALALLLWLIISSRTWRNPKKS